MEQINKSFRAVTHNEYCKSIRREVMASIWRPDPGTSKRTGPILDSSCGPDPSTVTALGLTSFQQQPDGPIVVREHGVV